jgi:hypothetical protein
MHNIEKQIFAIELNIKNGKVKNLFAAQNKISNLKAMLAAQNKATYWNKWLSM